MKRWYKITVYNQSLEAIADLKNAFDITYDLRMNGLSTAGFSLPASDPQTAYCEGFNYVEIFDGKRRVELFIIVGIGKVGSGRKLAIRYECVHVLWTLNWDLFFGYRSSWEAWTLMKDLGDETPAQINIGAFAYDTAHGVLVAGTNNNAQIWVSADGGTTWTLKKDLSEETPDDQTSIRALVYDSVNEVLIAGTHPDAQIWKSADGGDTWTLKKDLRSELPPGNVAVRALAYDPVNRVLIAGAGAELWKSSDAGETWTLKKDLAVEVPAQAAVHSLVYDVAHQVFVAGTGNDGQLWASSDVGETWTLKRDLSDETLPQNYIFALVYDSFHKAIIAGTATLRAQLWVSIDGAETWVLKKDLFEETPPQDMIIGLGYDATNHRIVAGTALGAQVWASINGGDTWILEKDVSEEAVSQVSAFGHDPINNVLVAGAYIGGIAPHGEIWRSSLYTPDILKHILAQQTVARWQLGTCDYNAQYAHKFENLKLLPAIWAVPAPIDAEWQYTFDTTSYPWTLNLVLASTDVAANVAYRRNLKTVGWKQNFRNVVTRLFAIGFGEGVNQLTVENENPTGEKYIDASTSYPQISGVLINRAIEDEEILYDEAVATLSDLSVAPNQFTVDTVDLARLNKRDYLDPGDYVRIEHEDIDLETTARVVRVWKRNVEKQPGKIGIEISETAPTLGGTVAGIASAVDTERTQAQGSTNVIFIHFAENADPDHPAELRFPIWSDVTYVNRVLLTYRLEPYRMFTRVEESGTCTTSSDAPANPHTHTVPDHSHSLVPAITEDDDIATAVTIEVDGATVEGMPAEGEDRNITQYLEGYETGTIVRGWHTIEITPNDGTKPARIVASVFVQTYVQSRGGDKY